MFKRFTRPTALLVAALLLAPLSPVSAASTATKYPLIISSGGYSTTIAKKPTRIISLSPSATEILYAIGSGKQVIAVDDLSNYPSEAPMTKLSAFNPNVEAILNYKPDLIILNADATKALEVKAALEKLKIKFRSLMFWGRVKLSIKQ